MLSLTMRGSTGPQTFYHSRSALYDNLKVYHNCKRRSKGSEGNNEPQCIMPWLPTSQTCSMLVMRPFDRFSLTLDALTHQARLPARMLVKYSFTTRKYISPKKTVATRAAPPDRYIYAKNQKHRGGRNSIPWSSTRTLKLPTEI